MKNTLIPFLHTLILAAAIVFSATFVERALFEQNHRALARDAQLQGQLSSLIDVVGEVNTKTTSPTVSYDSYPITLNNLFRPCDTTNSGCFQEEAAIAKLCKANAACLAREWFRRGWSPVPPKPLGPGSDAVAEDP